jgi:hypothetical protein
VRQREEVSLRSPLRSAFGKGENEDARQREECEAHLLHFSACEW